jgi:hypothetical protein
MRRMRTGSRAGALILTASVAKLPRPANRRGGDARAAAQQAAGVLPVSVRRRRLLGDAAPARPLLDDAYRSLALLGCASHAPLLPRLRRTRRLRDQRLQQGQGAGMFSCTPPARWNVVVYIFFMASTILAFIPCGLNCKQLLFLDMTNI